MTYVCVPSRKEEQKNKYTCCDLNMILSAQRIECNKYLTFWNNKYYINIYLFIIYGYMYMYNICMYHIHVYVVHYNQRNLFSI